MEKKEKRIRKYYENIRLLNQSISLDNESLPAHLLKSNRNDVDPSIIYENKELVRILQEEITRAIEIYFENLKLSDRYNKSKIDKKTVRKIVELKYGIEDGKLVDQNTSNEVAKILKINLRVVRSIYYGINRKLSQSKRLSTFLGGFKMKKYNEEREKIIRKLYNKWKTGSDPGVKLFFDAVDVNINVKDVYNLFKSVNLEEVIKIYNEE